MISSPKLLEKKKKKKKKKIKKRGKYTIRQARAYKTDDDDALSAN